MAGNAAYLVPAADGEEPWIRLTEDWTAAAELSDEARQRFALSALAYTN